jgi:NTE family protein/lysophospholipid hydrolase
MKAFLSSTTIFGGLSEEAVEQLLERMEPLSVKAGERLIHQGERGDRLFLILSGELQVVDDRDRDRPIRLAQEGPGEVVGEISLLTGEVRTASVCASKDSELLSLSRAALDDLARESSEHYDELVEAMQLRAEKSRMQLVVRRTSLFQGLDEDVLQDLEAEMELVTLASGATLVREGEPSDALFVVIGGRLRVVSSAGDGDETTLVEISRGQTVGEIGIITGEPRTATIVATRDSLLARLPADGFYRLLEKHPRAIMERFTGPVVSRLQYQLAHERVARGVSTIAVIPVGPEGPAATFARQLAGALTGLGSTLHLNSTLCDEYLHSEDISQATDDDPRHPGLVLWLSERESQHDFVIYEADETTTPWTRRCIHQADQIVMVAVATETPRWSEAALASLSAEETKRTIRRLVLLHEEYATLPRDTSRWLSDMEVASSHHVRLENAGDIERLARMLAGRGIALVLSGGGARGFGHIGVVKALQEEGIPADTIAGVSAGSIMGALFAMDLDAGAVLKRLQQASRPIDYTFPIHSLTSGYNWTRSMDELFGDMAIEDLWINYFCLSANLTQAVVNVHDSGSLMHGVRASTSIPGYLPPVHDNGEVLVDGGLFNNLPVDLAKVRPEIGVVIAVDVGNSRSMEYPQPFDYHVSGWRSLWQRVSPFGRPPELPSLGDILMQSISITNLQAAKESLKLVDLYLNPPIHSFGLTEFESMGEISEVGYVYAKEVLAEARKDGTLGRLGLDGSTAG